MIHQQQPPKLRSIFEGYGHLWDNDAVRPDARHAIARALQCKTPELGANVYKSPLGESRTVYHTCKSRACPSCGYAQTLRWQAEVASQLPEIPYTGVIFTIPCEFWPILRENRHLLPELPAIGAGVIQDWAREHNRAVVPVLMVRHTFNPKLEFNVHLHTLAGNAGVALDGSRAIGGIWYPVDFLRRRWRDALLAFLADTLASGALQSSLGEKAVARLIEEHRTRWWKIHVTRCAGKNRILAYISRYLRRPPLAEYRLLSSDPAQVRFTWKNKREQNCSETLQVPVSEFIRRFVDQIPDRYRHGVHYFGLLAPRNKPLLYRTFLRLIGNRLPRKPRRLRWSASLRACFGIDPLRDSLGCQMRFSHGLPPMPKSIPRAP